MGQQQLILLVLATVIVGIAIIIGIRAFNENSIKANNDAIIQDMVRMANDAQAWKQKPAPFGGQAENGPPDTQKIDPANYTGASFTFLGYAEVGGIYTNLNGSFKLTPAATGLTIDGCNPTKDNHATIVVNGLSDADITNTDVDLGTNTTCTAADPAL